ALKIHQLQKFRNCGDFIGFLRTSDLPQRQAKLAGPHTDRMQRAQTLLAIVAASRALAIDGKNGLVHAAGLGRLVSQRLQPTHKATLKYVRLEQAQHPPKNVFAWNSVGQIQDLQEELRFEFSPLGNRRRPARSRQHRQQRNDHDADERVFLIDGRAWIIEFVKVTNDFIEAHMLSLRHRLSSVSHKKRSHEGRYMNRSSRAQVYPDYPKCALALGWGRCSCSPSSANSYSWGMRDRCCCSRYQNTSHRSQVHRSQQIADSSCSPAGH